MGADCFMTFTCSYQTFNLGRLYLPKSFKHLSLNDNSGMQHLRSVILLSLCCTWFHCFIHLPRGSRVSNYMLGSIAMFVVSWFCKFGVGFLFSVPVMKLKLVSLRPNCLSMFCLNLVCDIWFWRMFLVNVLLLDFVL